ncbi:MAG TPA: aminopeptidase [Steroidobacteraceae bacterium]
MNISSITARARAAVGVALIALSGAGCYLLQSVQGQLALMSKREPIARVIEEPSTPPALRAQLETIAAIRDFASRELGLPDNGSYRSYADLGRPYVVWNVVAAPEFSVDAKQWCYPIVGCVAYRGYFVERKARRFAQALRGRGFDVTVGGVAAYSTLGHFNDPVLNTMMGWNDVELAAILFHELTHQLLYVPNDSSFNEALATTIEEEGVRRWLLAQGRGADLASHLERQEHYAEVIELLSATRAELRAVYASALGPDLKREKKRVAFAAMRASFARLKAGWDGHAPFETWFEGDLNNAHLASVATYFACVPGFERELEAAGGNLIAFYARVRALAKLDEAQRDALLCGAADAGSNGINSAAFVQQGQLERKADGEHDGDGKQPLCEPCNEIDLVHDVLRIAFVPGDEHIAPCEHPQQTPSLTAD